MESTTQVEIIRGLLPSGPIIERTLFHYLKRFPIEHPYISYSILGLILISWQTEFSSSYHQAIESIPVLGTFLPSYFVVILLMTFGDYVYHIKSTVVRRAMKVIIFLYYPFIISFFVWGLLWPIILAIKVLR